MAVHDMGSGQFARDGLGLQAVPYSGSALAALTIACPTPSVPQASVSPKRKDGDFIGNMRLVDEGDPTALTCNVQGSPPPSVRSVTLEKHSCTLVTSPYVPHLPYLCLFKASSESFLGRPQTPIKFEAIIYSYFITDYTALYCFLLQEIHSEPAKAFEPNTLIRLQAAP